MALRIQMKTGEGAVALNDGKGMRRHQGRGWGGITWVSETNNISPKKVIRIIPYTENESPIYIWCAYNTKRKNKRIDRAEEDVGGHEDNPCLAATSPLTTLSWLFIFHWRGSLAPFDSFWSPSYLSQNGKIRTRTLTHPRIHTRIRMDIHKKKKKKRAAERKEIKEVEKVQEGRNKATWHSPIDGVRAMQSGGGV